MSAFKVRRLSQHSNKTSKQKNQQRLKVQPERVVFEIDESMNKIFKLKITNLFSQIVQFQVKQPSQQCFKLKFSKKILSSNEVIEMFIFYNPQLNLGNINDQIIITSNINQGYKLKIPIFVRNADQLRKMKKYQRRKSKGKQNLKIIRLQSQNRHIGDNKRKAGILYSINKYKSAQNSLNQNNLTGRIQRFQQEFTKIQNFLKEKTIKSQIYRGEKPITKQEHYDIVFFNVTIEMMIKEIMKEKIIKRYQSEKSKNGPSIRVLDNIKIRWNRSRNEPKITYKKGLQKLLRQVRNFVIYHRFKKMNKILSIYRNLREEQSIEQPQTKIINKKLGLSVQQICSDKKSQIWNHDQDRQYHLQIQQKKKHDYYCRKINKIIGNKKEKNLGADFTQFTLSPRILPMDFEAPESKKNQTFQIKSRIGFDNWVTLQQSTPYNHELIRYSKIERIFQWECHPNYQFKSTFQTQKYSDNEITLTKKTSEKTSKSQEQKNRGKDMIQQLLKGNLDELEKQYTEVSYKKYSTYKTYFKTPTQCDFLLRNQFFQGQAEALKPLKLNSNAIQSMKEEDYFSYYSTPPIQLSLNFLDKDNLNNLIYNIRRDDIIDFDEVSQLTERKIMHLQKRELLGSKTAQQEHYLQQILNCTLTRQRMQQVSEKRAQNHEIVQNVVKTKERKMNIGQRRVKSYNWYVKNTNNIIYF